MKKTLAILLSVVILLSASALSASAARPPQKYGDVYYDEDINIMDATAVQQHLASVNELEPNRYEAADVDGDFNITIIDATIIQQYLAQIITEFPAGKNFLIDKYLYDVVPSYVSGRAQKGVEVDFAVSGYAHPSPAQAYLYVNDSLVDTGEYSNPTLSYTFPQAGIYLVSVVLTDKWGFEAVTWTQPYEVIDTIADTTMPVINNIAITEKYMRTPKVTVTAANGSGDYTYSYYISGPYHNEAQREFIYKKENVKENTIYIDEGYLDFFETYVITVVVKDSNGNSCNATTAFMCEMIAPA